MMKEPAINCPVQACRQLLELFSKPGEVAQGLEGQSANTWVFSYRDNFSHLWRMLDDDSFLEKLIAGDQQHTITVVWDGIPPRAKGVTLGTSVDTGEYLTPLDWAVAFSLTIADKLSKLKSQNFPSLKILILDLASDARRDAPGVRFFSLFPHRDVKSLPWIRLFSVAPGRHDGWPLLYLIRDATIHASLSESPAMPSMREALASGEQQELDTIRRIWATGITKPAKADDHHALANLIGPMLLMSDPSQSDAHVQALRGLMRSVLSKQEQGGTNDSTDLLTEDNSWINWEDKGWQRKLQRLGSGDKKLNFLLLDDQWKDGWGEVICKAVDATYNTLAENQSGQFIKINSGGKNPRISVKASSSADWLADKLDGLLKDKPDHRFELRLDSGDKDCHEILLLDLRLFSGKSVAKEALFIERLVGIARRINESNRLPWISIARDELTGVENWVTEVLSGKYVGEPHSDSRYYVALTLLPRILSLVDFSYPIILFSSTGRREIVEKFKVYGNIITDFDKPRLTETYPVDIAVHMENQFHSAMDKIFAMLAARNVCNSLQSIQQCVPVSGASQHRHVELFIDEYLSPSHQRVSVGGVFTIHSDDSPDAARIKADEFDDDLVRAGIRYFNALGVGESPPAILAKKACVSDQLESAMRTSEYKPELTGAIRLGHMYGNDQGVDILDQRTADNLYRLALSSLIELFLYELLPQITGQSGAAANTSVSIYVATRVKPYEDNTEDRSLLNREKYRFGFESILRNDKHLLFSMSRDSVFPLLEDILSLRRGGPVIDRAIGVTLCYQNPGHGKPASYPEYFICRSCNKVDRVRVRTLFPAGANQNLGRIYHMRKDMQCCYFRLLDDPKREVICYADKWSKAQEFSAAREGDVVGFENIYRTRKGYQGSGIELRNNVEAPVSVELAEQPVCECELPDFFPDYRAMHYVADEVLGTGNFPSRDKSPYRNVFQPEWVFSDELDESLNALLHAGRNLDFGNLSDAIAATSPAVGGGGGQSENDIKKAIMARIGYSATDMSGSDFIQVCKKFH